MGKLNKFFSDAEKSIEKLYLGDKKYIQMRLLVEDITEEYENKLKEKIDHSILHADIREAHEKDIDSIIILHDKAWHSTPMPYRIPSKEKLTEMVNNTDVVFLIAKVNAVDSGFIISYFTGNKKEIGVIAGLGILPELQRKGLGTILGLAAWNHFKQKGIKELRCKVYLNNTISYSFIKGLGFKEYGDDLATWKFF